MTIMTIKEGLIAGTIGVVAAAGVIYTFDHDPTIAPLTPATVTVTSTAPVVLDGWKPVSQELSDALSEGDDSPPENATTRDWEACVYNGVIGDVITIKCPDGYTTTQ